MRVNLDAIMLLKMLLDPGPLPQLTGLHIPPIGSQLVHSLSIVYPPKLIQAGLRNSFSWHAVADICCLRQQNVIFHYFHNLPLSQQLDPRLNDDDDIHPISHTTFTLPSPPCPSTRRTCSSYHCCCCVSARSD